MPKVIIRVLLLVCGAALEAVLSGMGMPAHAQTAQAAAPAVRPGADFDGYANGAWRATTQLPEGRSSYDTTALLRDMATVRIRDLVQAAADAPTSDRERRIGHYYASWLDEAAIEAKGLQPLYGDLAAIAAIRDRSALSAWLGGALRLDEGGSSNGDGLFGVWIHQGFRDGQRYRPHLVQGGLGLSDREIYLNATRENAVALDAYRAQIASVLTLAGFDQVDVRADRVVALEVAIAGSHAPRAHTDDVFRTDNPWARADFAASAPGMDWNAWFEASGLARQDEFIVWQPSAIAGTAALVGSGPIEAWQDYLSFHLIRHYSAALPRAFGGVGPDRRRQAIDATTAALGQDIGQLYVARYFPPEAKAAATAMAENLRTAFRTRLSRVAWMSPASRETALAKLESLKIGVGYPDVWIDTSGLEIRRDDALGNLRRVEAFHYQRALARLDRPVDPADWNFLLPQWPGAIINFSPNAIQFSAGILQPPYFDPSGDAATNYGSAGAGMAHEISHTFDELGGIYDAEGRLVRWWTPQDLAAYRAASAPMAAQLAAYCTQPDLCVNGDQVLAETTADLAGLHVAYDAYILSLNGRPDTVKDGLTGDQRFFLSFARRWRRLQTEAAVRQQFATDNHAPGAWRAATVRNHPAWIRAFDVEPGDALYLAPEERVTLW
jgi:putative endopeptidase